MKERIETEIRKAVRFLWEEQGGSELKENENWTWAKEILEERLEIFDYSQDLADYMDATILQGYKEACKKYQAFLEDLGPEY